MRIIGGLYKRRLIDYPKDISTRPTKDRIRESIFNALGDIEGKISLDLYAGSGSMGLESLSRGCNKAYFVDSSSLAIECCKKNVETLKIPSIQASFLNIKDFDALDFFSKNNIIFDIIFIDPPYEEGRYDELLEYIDKNILLNEDGVVVIEANRRLTFDKLNYKKIKEYKHGDIMVYILWR